MSFTFMQKNILIILTVLSVLLFIPSVHAMVFGGDSPGCRIDVNEVNCVLELNKPLHGFELLDVEVGEKALIRVDGLSSRYSSNYMDVYDYIVYTNSSDGSKMKLILTATGYSNNSVKAVMTRFEPATEPLYGDGGYCSNIYDHTSKYYQGISYSENGVVVNKADYCVDKHTLFDYNCLGSQPHGCREGETCKKGKCDFYPTVWQKMRARLTLFSYMLGFK